MSDSCDSAGDVGYHAPFPPIGTGLDAQDQAVYEPSFQVIYTNSINSVISIVLDEIHSIGQQEGGAIWEQILLLAPCPIMFVS